MHTSDSFIDSNVKMSTIKKCMILPDRHYLAKSSFLIVIQIGTFFSSYYKMIAMLQFMIILVTSCSYKSKWT
jgi:hypothetical protein